MIKFLMGLVLFGSIISLASYEVEAEYILMWNFEDGVLGVGENKTSGKISTRLITENTREGGYSLEIVTISDNSGGIEIVLENIKPEINYGAKAWIKSDSNTKQAFIRLAWYESTDGSGSQIKTKDSNKANVPDSWTLAEVQQIAPNNANSVKIRIYTSSLEDGLESKIIVDEIRWEEIITPTLTPTTVPTSVPTVKPTATNTPIPTVSVSNDIEEDKTDEQKDNQIINNDINTTKTNEMVEGQVLSDTHQQTIDKLRESQKITKAPMVYEIRDATDSVKLFTRPWDGWLAIGLGGALASVSIGSYIWSFMKGEYNKKNEN